MNDIVFVTLIYSSILEAKRSIVSKNDNIVGLFQVRDSCVPVELYAANAHDGFLHDPLKSKNEQSWR